MARRKLPATPRERAGVSALCKVRLLPVWGVARLLPRPNFEQPKNTLNQYRMPSLGFRSSVWERPLLPFNLDTGSEGCPPTRQLLLLHVRYRSEREALCSRANRHSGRMRLYKDFTGSRAHLLRFAGDFYCRKKALSGALCKQLKGYSAMAL